MNPRQDVADLLEQLDKWGTFILANLLWMVFVIPLITLPAATAGLFAVISAWGRGKPPELFATFFGAMRRFWIKSSLIVLFDLLVGGLLIINLSIFPMMDASDLIGILSRSVTLFVALLLGLMNLYLWSLLVLFDFPLRQLFTTSYQLVFTHPIWSFGILVGAIVPIIISLLLPQALFLFVTVSCVVWVITKGTWHIIRQYVSEDERRSLEAAHSSL